MKKYLPSGARILLGLIFLIVGFGKLVPFLPQPHEPAKAMGFLGGLMASGYFLPMLGGIETACGLLLLGNRFVPLVLAVLAPIIVNIAAFHSFLAPAGVPLAAVLLLLEIYLARQYRHAYRGMLVARSSPADRGIE